MKQLEDFNASEGSYGQVQLVEVVELVSSTSYVEITSLSGPRKFPSLDAVWTASYSTPSFNNLPYTKNHVTNTA